MRLAKKETEVDKFIRGENTIRKNPDPLEISDNGKQNRIFTSFTLLNQHKAWCSVSSVPVEGSTHFIN